MNKNTKLALLSYLQEFITPRKQEKIETVATNRTRHITVVLEDIYQSHNSSAAIRSSDAFGIQDIHIIEKKNKFELIENIALGSAKWIDTHRYTDTKKCLDDLKKDGYRIVATTPPAKDAVTLYDLPLDNKLAFIFGTEESGLSEQALEQADIKVTIPMYGFVESFNISVSVALCLHYMIAQLRQKNISWQLSDDELLDLKISFYKRAIRAGDQLERKFLSSR